MDSTPSSRGDCRTCLKATPWGAFAAAALFIGGVILWMTGTYKVLDFAVQFANVIGTPASASSSFRASAATAVTAIAVTCLVMAALVLLLSLFKALQRSALQGVCCARPQPWVFSAYRMLNFVMNFLMWLLLVVIVGVLMVMLLALGASAAVNAAVTSGIATADRTLAPVGLNFGSASDAQQAISSLVNPLISQTPLGDLITQTSAPFQAICPPICLNLGSFASVLQSNSCICGEDTLTLLRQLARDCMKVAGLGIAGAAAMYVACTVLLMVLSGHYVSASHDRANAKLMKQQQQLEYENGYVADPKDCIQEDILPVASAPPSRRGSAVPVAY